jgi:hypothetical protein
MYDAAVAGMEAGLLRRTPGPERLAYVSADANFEHLGCFLPGLLALDAYAR